MNQLSIAPCQIVICGKKEIMRVLAEQRFDGVISISDPFRNRYWRSHKLEKNKKQMQKHCSNVLQLQFWDSVNETQVEGPRGHHIAAIREFSKGMQGKKIAIHCMFGISRSPAAAVIFLRALGYPHDDAVKYVMLVKPEAMPNSLMLRLDESTSITDIPLSNEEI